MVGVGMGVEDPRDREPPLADEGEEGIGRARARAARLFVVVQDRVDERAGPARRIRDDVLNAACARLEEGIDPRMHREAAGRRLREGR